MAPSDYQFRIAGAPISWGVSEVPGWGVQLAPERVLSEMRELGLAATELGPEGFLPAAPAEMATFLGSFDLRAVGGFVPLVLHRDDADLMPTVERVLEEFRVSAAETLVLAAVTGDHGYDATRPDLSDDEWTTLLANLGRVSARASECGVTAVLHPHVGTVIETTDDIDRVLRGSAIGLCFDTGHLLIGGTDPVAFAFDHADRIAHVHLKDVSREGIELVKSGQMAYRDAIVAGALYRPLGQGDVDLRALITSLDKAGYEGWFVLEQDQVLSVDPPQGEGPIRDARTSIAFLRSLLGELAAERAGRS